MLRGDSFQRKEQRPRHEVGSSAERGFESEKASVKADQRHAPQNHPLKGCGVNEPKHECKSIREQTGNESPLEITVL